MSGVPPTLRESTTPRKRVIWGELAVIVVGLVSGRWLTRSSHGDALPSLPAPYTSLSGVATPNPTGEPEPASTLSHVDPPSLDHSTAPSRSAAAVRVAAEPMVSTPPANAHPSPAPARMMLGTPRLVTLAPQQP